MTRTRGRRGRPSFGDYEDGIVGRKSVTSLLNSRDDKRKLEVLFGERDLPSSVMQAERQHPTATQDEHGRKRGYKETEPQKDEQVRHLKGVGISGRGAKAGALSVFPQNICRSMILLYSEPGQVVFDPFAGHNSRMECCVREHRHYIGCDLSKDFMAFNRKRATQLRKMFPSVSIDLHHGDSRKVPVEDGVGDLTITSPPYWDTEDYGDEPGQLGKAKTYDEFLNELSLVMKENFRCLKPGAYCLYFANDFRKDDKFYSFHSHLIQIGEQIGFVQEDILIVDFGRGFGDVFLAQSVTQRRLPKRHEYGIVFRKPIAARTL